MTPSVAQSTEWINAGTVVFLDQAQLTDLAAPSGLPDWTNGHVVAHIARNAEGVERLLIWARTGVETPMYPSAEARGADIERDAGRSADIQLDDVRATAQSLARTLGTLGDTGWSRELRNMQGRPIPAVAVPFMRAKEMWFHGVDIGLDPAELPADFVAAALDDVAAAMAAKPEVPDVFVTATDTGWTARLGAGTEQVSGPALDVLLWLIGRTAAGTGLTGSRPALPRWL